MRFGQGGAKMFELVRGQSRVFELVESWSNWYPDLRWVKWSTSYWSSGLRGWGDPISSIGLLISLTRGLEAPWSLSKFWDKIRNDQIENRKCWWTSGSVSFCHLGAAGVFLSVAWGGFEVASLKSVWYQHIFWFGMLDEILEFSFSMFFGVDVVWSVSLLFWGHCAMLKEVRQLLRYNQVKMSLLRGELCRPTQPLNDSNQCQ
jgi:hypothetical protein